MPESWTYGPPAQWEPSEDAITEEARYQVRWHGACPACRSLGPVDDRAWDRWLDEHVEGCQRLRDRAAETLATEHEKGR